MKKILATYPNQILIVFALALSFPLLFQNALEYSFPMGYAGLFTQMAKQIADANFRLPLESPFYGPGGIPFAYPPLGLYLLAMLIKLTGKYYVFLRLLPPLLSLISLIPLFFLTLELSKSPLAAFVTVVLTATSVDLYIAHAWAAGVVRALAFLFALISIYFSARQRNSPSQINILLTGVFLGLTLMSHLMYALFYLVWIAWWTLFNRKFVIEIKDAVISVIIGLLTASIWVVPILLRHGVKVFFNAFNSHGGEETLSFWQSLQGLLSSFWVHLEPITSSPWLSLLVLIGVIALLAKRKFVLILFYLFVVMLFPEQERFVFLVGCIVAGLGVSAYRDWLLAISKNSSGPWAFAITFIPVLGMVWWNGYQTLSRYIPLLSNAELDMALHVDENVLVDETYLALIKQDEAEWMPFLFQRQPLVSQWGSEWLGSYNEQTYRMLRFGGCQANQDWSCVENVITEIENSPNALVTYVKDEKLNQQLASTDQWTQVYINEQYMLWLQND